MSKPLIVIGLLIITALVLAGAVAPYLAARRIIRPEPGTQLTVPAVSYAPSPHQTDGTPCTTASGTRVRRGTIATNFLPMGTVLKIEEEFFIVEDRMHPRYGRIIDIFSPSTSEAREFGTQSVELTVISYGKPGQPLPGREQSVESEPTPPPSLFQRWQGGVNYIGRLLKASAPTDVNTYDVKCFEE